jgi:hypothetical protein
MFPRTPELYQNDDTHPPWVPAMSEQLQALLAICGLVTALTGALATVVTALCWFLRRLVLLLSRLVETTLPSLARDFRTELAEERERCHRDHERIVAIINQRHAELLAELRRRTPS